MFETLLRKLTIWRNETAKREGVELFRVLSNKTLEEIARTVPRNKKELTGIKGIKEAKYGKYGREILRIVAEESDIAENETQDNSAFIFFDTRPIGEEKEKIFSVGEYLDFLNGKLSAWSARIKGEISSVDERQRAVYFSIKDSKDESVMNCFIFRYQYDVLGVRLEEGMEVVVSGYPEIYKPYGRLSLRVSSIELEGEGELKKEYERLKKKLEKEGLFAESGKKKFEDLPQKIGLITSREGAAIGDFMSNIGQFGLRIRFINSSVEGRRAVFELINAIRFFSKSDIDALVIIRGGGSLESLQAFNNEALIREAKKTRMPLVCGVGHDRDISLLSLAADYSVSTPTAAARLIGGLWEKEIGKMDYFCRAIMESYGARLLYCQRCVRDASYRLDSGFREIIDSTEDRYDGFLRRTLDFIENDLYTKKNLLDNCWQGIVSRFALAEAGTRNLIDGAERTIKLNDPQRHLKMGYGIISKDGSSVRSVEEMREGDVVKIRVWDGEAKSKITIIKKFK
jgi:exodeoxyribonuclease VII large subunit